MKIDSQSVHRPATNKVYELFRSQGGSQYGGEAVSQLEHALQAAFFAEQEGANACLISAALLHDIGHLLHDLPADAPDRGIDDVHENLGATFLLQHFPAAVVEPVKLHVAAKRYLCAVEPSYRELLSPPSLQSLQLQGGSMTPEEVVQFESNIFFQDAVALRRWDDRAKITGLVTPYIEHFLPYLDQAAAEGSN